MGRPKWAQDQRQALRPRQGCPRLPPRSSLARGVRWRQRGGVRVRPGRAAVCHASCHTVAVSPPAANSVLGEVVQAYVSNPLLVKPQSVCQPELSLIRRSRPNRPALRRCQLETSVTVVPFSFLLVALYCMEEHYFLPICLFIVLHLCGFRDSCFLSLAVIHYYRCLVFCLNEPRFGQREPL